MQAPTQADLDHLAHQLTGELHYESLHKTLYATDASVYRELPIAVAIPKTEDDLRHLIAFANTHKTGLIPRAAGTSLAGQCVGSGIVVDVSKYFNKILEVNVEERWARVQPGVVRDVLNDALKPHGLFFSPITSTANRATIGGMVGNNSCGTTSIRYGSAREHTLELRTLLSDGSEAIFKARPGEEIQELATQPTLEGKIYRQLLNALSDADIRREITECFPRPEVTRRNTGYAVDFLLHTEPFGAYETPFDLCKLLCGSEGTLAFTTEIKLHLDPLPPPEVVVIAAHFDRLRDSLEATVISMRHRPYAVELMDKIILDCTKDNIEQRHNRFFVEGDPEAILMIELRADDRPDLDRLTADLVTDLKTAKLGYAYPLVHGADTKRVWTLRKAGLGLLANIPGDKKAVACIEDTAVALTDLPDYIDEFGEIMDRFGQRAVHYAHAGAGELHLRPILNLKDPRDVDDFYQITLETAKLVRKYRGSLSGEHGDGRVRAAFLEMMVGEKNYQLFRDIKRTWDPHNLFNPGKIVDAPPMNEQLRTEVGAEVPEFDTVFDFASAGGILRLAEKCNGSGDCRKTPVNGGVMCPSYMATRNERDTTRARANVLREILTNHKTENPFNHPDLKEVMDLCLSCKGCTSECPSNVDMTSMKAEWQHQYHQANGIPLRTRAVANIGRLNAWASTAPGLSNFFLGNKWTSGILKKTLGIAEKRSLPPLHRTTLRKWFRQQYDRLPAPAIERGALYLFCDEFTNYNDTPVGIATIKLLRHIGYEVRLTDHPDSGRAQLSKGLLTEAQRLATENVRHFRDKVNATTPLVGIEPSALLGFRDEYPRLVPPEEQTGAWELAKHCYLLSEFLVKAVERGELSEADFSEEAVHIKLHGHCHQKALSDPGKTAMILGLPKNATLELIPSGCCGMAGSFGYEAEHYEVSMQIGELVLFPAVRKAPATTLIAAPGTSCRHQILDGTGRRAFHPAELLERLLRRKV